MSTRSAAFTQTCKHCCWLFLIFLLFPFPARAEEQHPAKAYISGVNGHPQNYSLSCESRSAVDWAAYFGVEISEKKFLNHLPHSDNPNIGFVGRPEDPLGNLPPRSYGVHAEPVAALLREYGLAAQAGYELDWEQVKAEIAADRPVIVWVIGQMWDGIPIRYTAANGEKTTVARYEHTMILVGYSPKYVFAIDAATGLEGNYSIGDFFASWEVLGRMAITAGAAGETTVPVTGNDLAGVLPQIPAVGQYPTLNTPGQLPDPTIRSVTDIPRLTPFAATQTPASAEPTEVQTLEAPQFYTVRRGDYLTGIAKRFGVNWRNLARVNHLSTPYILYTGQKLRIP